MAILNTFERKLDIYNLSVSQDTDYVLYSICGTKQTVVESGNIVSGDTVLLPINQDGKYKLVLSASGETDLPIEFTVYHNLQKSILIDIETFLSCNTPVDNCSNNNCYSNDVKEYLQYKDLFVKLNIFQGLYFDSIADSLSTAFANFMSASMINDRCSFQSSINKILKEECIYGSASTTNALLFDIISLYYYAMYFVEKNLASGNPDELEFLEDKFGTDTIPELIMETTCTKADVLEDIFDNALSALNTKPTVNNTTLTPANNLPGNIYTHTFVLSDFTNGFADVQGDSPKNVKFGLLPVRGTLKYNGVNVVVGTAYPLTNVGLLVYSTTIDVAQSNYDNILFQVSDDNVIELYSDMANVTINTAAYVNQPISQLGNLTLNKGNRENHTFTINDFTTNLVPAYVDPEGDSLDAIRIDSLPAAGQLRLNGVPVSVNDIIPATSINSGLLVFVAPSQDASGSNVWSFSARDAGSLQWVSS